MKEFDFCNISATLCDTTKIKISIFKISGLSNDVTSAFPHIESVFSALFGNINTF